LGDGGRVMIVVRVILNHYLIYFSFISIYIPYNYLYIHKIYNISINILKRWNRLL